MPYFQSLALRQEIDAFALTRVHEYMTTMPDSPMDMLHVMQSLSAPGRCKESFRPPTPSAKRSTEPSTIALKHRMFHVVMPADRISVRAAIRKHGNWLQRYVSRSGLISLPTVQHNTYAADRQQRAIPK
jgi:hypothetical protein